MEPEDYYVGVAPRRRADSYQAFVHDPCSSGRYIRTHQCVLFVACPTCGSDIYIPCISARETTRQVKTKNHGWVSVDYFPHVAIVCLTRRARWREVRKANRRITARHRVHLETVRLLARKAEQE